MINILFYGIAAFTGLIVKLVDFFEDDAKTKSPVKFFLAILYGLLIGYTISFSTFSTLWIAVLFAQFLTGKIDNNSHFLGFFTSITVPIILGLGDFQILDFFILLIFASLDETKLLAWSGTNLRLALKFGTLLFVIFGRWDYFIAIMCFDLTYYATTRLLLSSKTEDSSA